MKIIVSRNQFEKRRAQFIDLMIACDASLKEIEEVANMTLKEINTDLLKVVIDNDDIIIIVDDSLEDELMGVFVENAPLIVASAKAFLTVWKAFDKKISNVYKKHIGHFYDQLCEQFRSKDE